MGCDRIGRWISDDLDGALSPRRRNKLRAHLVVCSACRAYSRGLKTIQAAARATPGPDLSPDYWPEALDRLASRIRKEPAPRHPRPLPAFLPAGRWAWAGAASLLAAGVLLYLVLAPARVAEETFPATFEEEWSVLDRQFGDDPELAQAFASSLQSVLNESLREVHGEVVPLLDRQTLFLEDLSDEEVRLLNVELAKEITN